MAMPYKVKERLTYYANLTTMEDYNVCIKGSGHLTGFTVVVCMTHSSRRACNLVASFDSVDRWLTALLLTTGTPVAVTHTKSHHTATYHGLSHCTGH